MTSSQEASLTEPAERDIKYGGSSRTLIGNVAQYLIDLHNAKQTFDFCGGMLFQLVLSKKLKAHLEQVAAGKGAQPVVYDAKKTRMNKIPGYSKSSEADNVSVFHGREVRQPRHLPPWPGNR